MLSQIFFKKNESVIHLTEVDLGVCRVSIPVAEIGGKRPGPTLLVTGGMDGDEYTGIEAAYRLITELQSFEFAGTVIVVPIVNMPGFAGECSQNPLDGEFPKETFPGKNTGSPTERLMYWLSSTYVSCADVWHDMHAGAITEGLNPFLRTYGDNAVAMSLRQSGVADLMVSTNASWGTTYARIADVGCTYILAESGGRGNREPQDVERHVRWVRATMSCMGMTEKIVNERKSLTRIISRIEYIQAPYDGLWRPIAREGHEINKGMLLGEIVSFDGNQTKEIHAGHDGIRLWWKETMRMQQSDVLYAIGH